MLVTGIAVSAGPALAQDPSAPSGGSAAPSSGAPAPTDGTAPTTTTQQSGGAQYGSTTGSTTSTPTSPVVEGVTARIMPDGLAAAPSMAPAEVQRAIWAANRIIGKPYIYGGGHNARFAGHGYDCSGTVSFALHGANLLTTPLDSGSFMRWGAPGAGQWMTIWTNPGHMFLVIAGIRLDTSSAGDPSGKRGPRWRPVARLSKGFHARHPANF